jgi:hypothetical protein
MRFISIAATAVALPLLVTACKSTSQQGTSGPGGATASSAAASPTASPLTGIQLKAMLAPASWFPSGFAIDPTGSVDTGDSYQQPSSAGRAPGCIRLDGTAWVQLAGVGSVSFAQNDYIDRSISEQYAQEIDVYQGTSAKDVMTGLRRLARTCPSFHDAQTSSTVTVKLRQGPALGDDSLTFRLKSPRWQGGTALEAVRVGTAVVTVLYSAASGTGTAQATKLATTITRRLKRAS